MIQIAKKLFFRARKEAIQSIINKEGYGIEIGPSFRPLAPKKEGYKVTIVDHCQKKELLLKYAHLGNIVLQIEEVDVVISGIGSFDRIEDNKYDWIIASHVLEHIPNLLGFLKEMFKKLSPGGQLILILPNKDFTFDTERENSSLSKVLQHFEEDLTNHKESDIVEYFLAVVDRKKELLRPWKLFSSKTPMHTMQEMENAIAMRRKGNYIDIHAWVFTLRSLKKIFDGLSKLKAFEFEVRKCERFFGTEILCILERKI